MVNIPFFYYLIGLLLLFFELFHFTINNIQVYIVYIYYNILQYKLI